MAQRMHAMRTILSSLEGFPDVRVQLCELCVEVDLLRLRTRPGSDTSLSRVDTCDTDGNEVHACFFVFAAFSISLNVLRNLSISLLVSSVVATSSKAAKSNFSAVAGAAA